MVVSQFGNVVFVSCVQRRVVEASGVGSGGFVVHFNVHGE